jgi:hypothetical protein
MMTADELKVHELVTRLDTASVLNPRVNLVSIIAANCGWHPLKIGEKMTVGINNEEYVIVRNPDRR